jgi:hypothetical protein
MRAERTTGIAMTTNRNSAFQNRQPSRCARSRVIREQVVSFGEGIQKSCQGKPSFI